MQNTAFTKNIILKFLLGILPNRMKRMVYLSSFTAILNDNKVNEEICQRLNGIMHLCNKTDKSMKLPMELSNVIWANKEVLDDNINTIKKNISKTTCSAQCIKDMEQIIKYTPTWLKYDDDEKILKDLKVICNRQNKLVNIY